MTDTTSSDTPPVTSGQSASPTRSTAGRASAAGSAETEGGGPEPQRQTLRGRVLDALWNTMELRVLTVVGDLDFKDFDTPGKTGSVTPTGNQRGLFTSINMVTGDIRCAVSPEYEAGGNEEMRAFHTKQVELGRDIVASNLRLLGELAGTFADLFKRSPDEDADT